MATVTKSIGTSSRDYSTIALWEAALGGAAGGAGNDAVGECYNDSNFTEDIAFNDTTPGSWLLTVPEAERHDGTAGTGVVVELQGNTIGLGIYYASNGYNAIIEWLEVDGKEVDNNNVHSAIDEVGNSDGFTIRNMLVHGIVGTNNNKSGIDCNPEAWNILNCIVYNIRFTATGDSEDVVGIYNNDISVNGNTQNCTVYRIVNNGTANSVSGINDGKVSNCVSMGVSHTGGTPTENDFANTSTQQYNISEDTTATGTGSLTEKNPSNQFVSIVSGSEDLHLKSGSDAIGAGTDLGTTNGVNIDIDGRDRDAEGDTWDIGAHQFVVGSTLLPINDTCRGQDSVSVFVSLAVQDAGSGSDEFGGMNADIPVVDSCLGSDEFGGMDAEIPVVDSCLGFDEFGGMNADIPVADSCLCSDDFGNMDASVQVADSTFGSDAINVLSEIIKTVSDLAFGSDSLSVPTVSLSVSDAGVGADLVGPVSVSLLITDEGSAQDIINVIKTKLIQVADSGHGSDSVSASVSLTVTDVAKATDMIGQVLNALSVSDVASGSDAVLSTDLAFLPSGEVTISFSIKVPGISFALKKPGASFSLKKPGIDFTIN